MTELTIISIIATFMAIIVAINVAYNFYSIYDFRRRLEKLQDEMKLADNKIDTKFDARIKAIEEQAKKDSVQIQAELENVKNLYKDYDRMQYQMSNANARFDYDGQEYFRAIIEEFKNIYHVITHKSSFSNDFEEIIGVKFWFIAKDLLKCEKDKNVVSNTDEGKFAIIGMRDSLIEICNKIKNDENAVLIDIKGKLDPLFYAARNIADAFYHNHKDIILNVKNSPDWQRVVEIAK